MESSASYSFENLQNVLNEYHSFIEDQLKLSSLQIMLFEYLRHFLSDQLQGFFGDPYFDKNGKLQSKVLPEYQHLFAKSDKSVLEKHLNWWMEMGAITNADVEFIQAQRNRRNDIGHRMFNVICDEKIAPLLKEECQALVALIFKLDNWWIREIEMSVNPDFPGRDDENVCREAASIATQMLVNFVHRICG